MKKNGEERDQTLKMETGNKIGNDGVKALCEMLKVNTRLDYLYLYSEGKRQRTR